MSTTPSAPSAGTLLSRPHTCALAFRERALQCFRTALTASWLLLRAGQSLLRHVAPRTAMTRALQMQGTCPAEQGLAGAIPGRRLAQQRTLAWPKRLQRSLKGRGGPRQASNLQLPNAAHATPRRAAAPARPQLLCGSRQSCSYCTSRLIHADASPLTFSGL